jgi:hypothetical protein
VRRWIVHKLCTKKYIMKGATPANFLFFTWTWVQCDPKKGIFIVYNKSNKVRDSKLQKVRNCCFWWKILFTQLFITLGKLQKWCFLPDSVQSFCFAIPRDIFMLMSLPITASPQFDDTQWKQNSCRQFPSCFETTLIWSKALFEITEISARERQQT